MCTTQAFVQMSSLVYLLFFELHVTRVVVDAVVGWSYVGSIAHVVVVVFVVAIFHGIFCIWRYTLYTLHTLTFFLSTTSVAWISGLYCH